MLLVLEENTNILVALVKTPGTQCLLYEESPLHWNALTLYSPSALAAELLLELALADMEWTINLLDLQISCNYKTNI